MNVNVPVDQGKECQEESFSQLECPTASVQAFQMLPLGMINQNQNQTQILYESLNGEFLEK